MAGNGYGDTYLPSSSSNSSSPPPQPPAISPCPSTRNAQPPPNPPPFVLLPPPPSPASESPPTAAPDAPPPLPPINPTQPISYASPPPPPTQLFSPPPPTLSSPPPPPLLRAITYASPPPPPTLLSPPPPSPLSAITYASPPPPATPPPQIAPHPSPSSSPPPPIPPPPSPSPSQSPIPPPSPSPSPIPPSPQSPISPPPPPPVTTRPLIYASPPPPPSLQPPPPPSSPPPNAPPPSPAPAPAPAPYPSNTIRSSPPPPRMQSPPWKARPPTPQKPHSVNSSSIANLQRPSATGKNNIEISREVATTIVVVSGLVILSFLGAAVWFVKQQRRRPEAPAPVYTEHNLVASPMRSSLASGMLHQRSPAYALSSYSAGSRGGGFPYSPSHSGVGFTKLLFSLEDLSRITNGFARENLLGEGGFGCVYKGCLPDGRVVAVKKLKVGNGQGEREFRAEVDTISRVHHRHLVSLVGYCISDGQRMLVYDYVPNNTLYYHLHGKGGPAPDWPTRIKIAAGAARGIAYLHEDCHPRIVHRDIKSSNILLDNNFAAQVSDFGLARLAADTNTHVSTQMMGTFGYLAPEYALSGKWTSKSDVYSFGVVLLELITGRKPIDSSRPLGDESLVEWARPYLIQALEDRVFEDLVDPRLGNEFDENEMYHMIEAAAACVRRSAMRPRMGQVVRTLDSLADSNLNSGLPACQSEVFLEPQTEEIRMFQLREFGSRDYSGELSQSSCASRRES